LGEDGIREGDMKNLFLVLAILGLVTGAAEGARQAPVTDGVYRTYYPSGALQKEEHYRNKQLSGKVSEYYENGKLRASVGYVAGQREGAGQTYYETGVLKSEGTYRNGSLQGVFKEYDGAGNLSLEKNYINGVLEGIAKTYYPSGMISKQVYYKNAVLNGTAIEFADNGRPRAEESYQDGVLLQRRELEAEDKFLTRQAPSSAVVLPPLKKEAAVSVQTEFAADGKR
jgi:hypothetical protein